MEPIAELRVSQGRRLTGTFAQVGIGVLMIYIAIVYPPENLLALGFLVAFGILMIVQSRKLYQATSRSLLLTRETLEDSSGAVLCRLEDIKSVERGAFSFKPSNGFSINLKAPAKAAWCPGLWWRIGRRVGVGGTTSGKAAKDMADMIAVLLTDRGAEILADIEAAAKEQSKD